jgi:ATP citrate (pro-S)-lyase
MRELATSFPATPHLDFAIAVEQLTLQKKPNLILNVDGHIAALLLDMMLDM